MHVVAKKYICIAKIRNMQQKLDIDLTDSFEKIPVKIFETSKDGSQYVAQEISKLIREKQSKGEDCIL